MKFEIMFYCSTVYAKLLYFMFFNCLTFLLTVSVQRENNPSLKYLIAAVRSKQVPNHSGHNMLGATFTLLSINLILLIHFLNCGNLCRWKIHLYILRVFCSVKFMFRNKLFRISDNSISYHFSLTAKQTYS